MLNVFLLKKKNEAAYKVRNISNVKLEIWKWTCDYMRDTKRPSDLNWSRYNGQRESDDNRSRRYRY